MNRKALSFAFAVAALMACTLPALAFPPQCGCKYCWEHPDSLCLVGPVFFNCVDWYEDFCPISTSATAVEASEKAMFPFDSSAPCSFPASVPSEPVD